MYPLWKDGVKPIECILKPGVYAYVLYMSVYIGRWRNMSVYTHTHLHTSTHTQSSPAHLSLSHTYAAGAVATTKLGLKNWYFEKIYKIFLRMFY